MLKRFGQDRFDWVWRLGSSGVRPFTPWAKNCTVVLVVMVVLSYRGWWIASRRI